MTILCCLCGTTIEANGVNMCSVCLSTQVDISEGIEKEVILHQCKGCLRFQRGQAWVDCDLESPELMALCLKNVNGLAKAKLVDASFIWTEPHSKRIKVKVSIRKEALRGTVLQQSFVVVFVVRNLKCFDCGKQYHNNTWRSVIQVRQKVDHKRTFFYLEQLLIQFQAHAKCVGIDSTKDGIDFFFGEKNSAETFCHFLSSHVPIKSKNSSKLISSDNHNNTANIKNTTVVEIAPVCKEDLVILPKFFTSKWASAHNLFLVSRITSQIHVVDPFTAKRYEISADKFWRHPFNSLETNSLLSEFVVLDIERVPTKSSLDTTEEHSKQYLADVEVARACDFGVNDRTFMVRTHLGGVLHHGDTVKGYDLSTTNYNDRLLYNLKNDLPEIILVRRCKTGKKNRRKLKSLGVNNTDGLKKSDAKKLEDEYTAFLEEFDDNAEMEEELNEKLDEKLVLHEEQSATTGNGGTTVDEGHSDTS